MLVKPAFVRAPAFAMQSAIRFGLDKGLTPNIEFDDLCINLLPRFKGANVVIF